jgi:[ribosomal protein S18]-alanine N-acetyltransferase
MSTIRNYVPEDKDACLRIFNSNCPAYFDVSEHDLFIRWLDHQSGAENGYSSPTYSNALTDAYYVIEDSNQGVVGCGGFYVTKDLMEVRLAWGMIHADFHNKGLGTSLYNYRREIIERDWPEHTLTLGTSQHTYAFYERMGLKVVATIPSGYGKDLDRYDMEL